MVATRVAVWFGGPSAEHEISIRSADGLIGWLSAGGLAVDAFHWRRDGLVACARLEPGAAREQEASALAADAAPALPLFAALERLARDCDVGFPIVHGRMGEDGSLQGLLRVIGKPCVGAGVLGSALAMDKQRTKELLMGATTLRLPRGVAFGLHECREGARVVERTSHLPTPLIVKPVDGGSSFGLACVDARCELPAAVARAAQVEGASGVLVEERIEGDEVTCALIGDAEIGIEAFPPILIRPRHGGMFDLEAKYTPGASDEICPAPLPPAALRRIEAAATEAYRALGASGFARADFILRDGVPWFLELNTLPGLTRESLFPKAALAAGYQLPALFRQLVERALRGRRAFVATPR